MAAHKTNLPTAREAVAQGDHTRLREQLRERQAWLGQLRAGALAAHERLDRFAREWFVEEHPDYSFGVIGPVEIEGLDEAATTVLAVVQAELLRSDSRLEMWMARAIARERFQAIRALSYGPGERHAKEVSIAISGTSAPLTVCTGEAYRIRGARQRPVTTLKFGEVAFAVQGCGAIFSDSLVTSGNSMWPFFCPACRSEHRKPARTQTRALLKRISKLEGLRDPQRQGPSMVFPIRRTG